MAKSIYSRVLLKLSGETLKGDLDFGYSPESCAVVVERVKTILACNVKVALVVGAGNIWRGGRAGDMMNRADADKMGMLATMMNAIALKNFFTAAGVPVLLHRRDGGAGYAASGGDVRSGHRRRPDRL